VDGDVVGVETLSGALSPSSINPRIINPMIIAKGTVILLEISIGGAYLDYIARSLI